MGRPAVWVLALAVRAVASESSGCDGMPAQKPDDINPLAQRGIELSHKNDYGPAADCYRKVLAIDSNIPEIQLNLGLAEFKQGHFEPAVTAFDATLKLD